jgi:uncharacterized membrane protein
MFISFAKKNAVERSASEVRSERPVRSLVKALSWRVAGSLDTMLLSWFFTGDLTIAAAIGSTEIVTKMVLYYLHERAWNRIPLGRTECSRGREDVLPETRSGVAPAWRPVTEND